jgi:pSer/pThr/pTyr-binding forkhead associated (FHA) protein
MLSSARATMTGFLLLTDGRQVAVRDGLTLGRVAACDVVIDDTKASRRHATLHVDGAVVEIEDLDSSNGTLLNGKAVKRRVLREGDVIQIGATAITFREQAASAVAPVEDELTFDEPEPAAPPVRESPRPAPAQPAPTRPASPVTPPPVETLEFLDEVVQVRAQPVRPDAASAKGRPGAAAPARRERGVLQFHKREGGGGLLADDLQQMGSGKRFLMLLLALAVAGALGYLVMRFTQ